MARGATFFPSFPEEIQIFFHRKCTLSKMHLTECTQHCTVEVYRYTLRPLIGEHWGFVQSYLYLTAKFGKLTLKMKVSRECRTFFLLLRWSSRYRALTLAVSYTCTIHILQVIPHCLGCRRIQCVSNITSCRFRGEGGEEFKDGHTGGVGYVPYR